MGHADKNQVVSGGRPILFIRLHQLPHSQVMARAIHKYLVSHGLLLAASATVS